MEIGAKIKSIRLRRGLTQEELAMRAELTKGYISQLENDLASPSIATLMDILNVLGVTLQAFFAEEKEEQVVFGKNDFFLSQNGTGSATWLFLCMERQTIQEPKKGIHPQIPYLQYIFKCRISSKDVYTSNPRGNLRMECGDMQSLSSMCFRTN